MYLLFTDGGSRDNPGIAGAGVVLCSAEGQVLDKVCQPLGIRTNNQAEYQALILGLEIALQNKVSELTVFLDSKLVVEQMMRRWKVKDPELQKLFNQAQGLVDRFTWVEFKHIPREKNKLADALANEAMDRVSY